MHKTEINKIKGKNVINYTAMNSITDLSLNKQNGWFTTNACLQSFCIQAGI